MSTHSIENAMNMSSKAAISTPQRSMRRFAVRLFCVSAALGLVVMALEVGVRLLSREGESLLVKDDRIGQRYRTGFQGARFVPEAGRVVELRFNRDGFRGQDWDDALATSGCRIAVLGDSFVAAVGVSESETMTARLEVELKRGRAANNIVAFNCGVSGFGTAQELLAWRHFASRLRPQIVIVCFYNGNDLADNCERLSTANRPYFTLDPTGQLELHPMSASRSAASRWLTEYSHLYVWQRNQMRLARDRLREWSGTLPPGFEIFRKHPSQTFAEAWQLTEKLLESLRTEVEAGGATLVLAQIPCHEQLYDHDWAKLLATVPNPNDYERDRPETAIAAICKRRGIFRVSLLGPMSAAAGEEQLFFPGNGHWNERGNALAAEALAKAVLALPSVAWSPRLDLGTKPTAGERR